MEIRPFTDQDVAAFIPLFNLIRTTPITEEEWRRMLPRDLSTFYGRFMAWQGDQAVGFASLRHQPMLPPGALEVRIIVALAHRGKGYGDRLFAALQPAIAEQRPSELSAAVQDDDPGSRSWMEERGFSLHRHQFESVLDLSTFEPEVHRRPAPEGITYITLAELAGEADERRLYELMAELDRQTPDREGSGQSLTYEQARRFIFDSERTVRDATFIACQGEEWVGLTITGWQAPGELYTGFTGVLPQARGKGLARALKLLAAEWGQRNGAVRMSTHNDSRNGPMLAVNRSIGYQPRTGTWWMRKTL